MTTGNIVVDNTYPVTVVYNGSPLTSATAGNYRSRVWSGTDDPVKGLGLRASTSHDYWIPGETSTKLGEFINLERKSYSTVNRNKHRREPHAFDTTRIENWFPPSTAITNQFVSGSLYQQGFWTNTPMSVFFNGASPLAVNLTSNDALRAIQKLREKILGTPWNAAVMVGEAAKTFIMIGDTATKLAMSLWYLRRGDFRNAIRATADPRSKRASQKYASNPYLQVTYGWTPLLLDLKNGAESLAHRFTVPFRQKYSVRVRGEMSLPNGANRVQHPSHPSWWWTAYGYTGVTRQIVAEISDEPSWIPALGFTDPASFIWELMPFSFVADWFYPFGTWLEARASAGLLRGKFVVTDTQRVKFRGPLSGTFGDPSSGTYSTIDGFDAQSEVGYTKVIRSIVSSLDVPMPDTKPLTEAASVKHCLNGVALFNSIFDPGNTRRSLRRLSRNWKGFVRSLKDPRDFG